MDRVPDWRMDGLTTDWRTEGRNYRLNWRIEVLQCSNIFLHKLKLRIFQDLSGSTTKKTFLYASLLTESQTMEFLLILFYNLSILLNSELKYIPSNFLNRLKNSSQFRIFFTSWWPPICMYLYELWYAGVPYVIQNWFHSRTFWFHYCLLTV